ncbi:ankyrin repeat-containing domain protein [Xylaria scruposa]|nr:ankyrin repeat-containing domain protein [Xylaria scruposa]
MPLFNLPVEIVERIFDQIIVSRTIARVMRIRLVNGRHDLGSVEHVLTLLTGRFKYFIDNSIFRLRFLSTLDKADYLVSPARRSSARESLPYLHLYLMHQALRARPRSLLGRIRIVAQALSGSDTDLECLSSLVSLAMAENLHGLLMASRAGPSFLDPGDATMEVDVLVAAAHLGRKDYLADVIAKGILPSEAVSINISPDSRVFGWAFLAAAIHGNLEIIKLFLSHFHEYDNARSLLCYRLLARNDVNTCRHEAVYDFVLDTIIAQSKSGRQRERSIFKAALLAAPTPNSVERAAALLPPTFWKAVTWEASIWKELLMRNVEYGNIGMVRHLLSKDVSPNIKAGGSTSIMSSSSIMEAIEAGHDTIVSMLLDSDADPTYEGYDKNNALMKAVWHGRMAIARILLARGVNPNVGNPPPIVLAVFKEHMNMFHLLRDYGARLDTSVTGGLAMKLARFHGLSSMEDVLVHEGIITRYCTLLPRLGHFTVASPRHSRTVLRS